jgi:hypothetical protein
MLKALQDQGCTLADEDWAKNHWAQVIWKLSGLARSGAPDAKEKWKWEEAMRQMLYRYDHSFFGLRLFIVTTDMNARLIAQSVPLFGEYKNTTLHPPSRLFYA